MPKTISVIGIGGTGMRCLESFIHLCAMGMFDDHEVVMLALDTDCNNGNFKRVRNLVANYSKLSPREPAKNTFFSAKLTYFEFSPDYQNATFDTVTGYEGARNRMQAEDSNVHASDLVDMFITPDVRAMNLEHGYRAQTQMGSLLMYRAIVEEAIRAKNTGRPSPLRDFLNKSGLSGGTNNKVFIFGSVFGGTGASSIPVIPKALNLAAQIFEDNDARDILTGNMFGTVVLTHYFSFTRPEKGKEVVADADRFALNSQAALMFYEADSAVRSTYKRFYLIGRMDSKMLPEGTKTDTGGDKQENPADFVELMAAFAAYDFFKEADKGQDAFKGNEMFYVVEHEENLKFVPFAQFTADHALFRKSIGALTATAMANARGELFRQQAKDNFTDVTDEELQALLSYLDHYFYMRSTDKTTYKQGGWLQQLANSAHREFGNDVPFLFDNEVFDESVKIDKKKFNERMFVAEVNPPKFATKGVFGDTLYNQIKDTFQTKIKGAEDQHTTMEQMIRDAYNTFVTLYSLDR